MMIDPVSHQGKREKKGNMLPENFIRATMPQKGMSKRRPSCPPQVHENFFLLVS